MRESAVEAKLRKSIKRLGGMSIKMLPTITGLPDRLILIGGQVFLVELKADGGRLRPIQRVMHERLADIGFTVWVLSGSSDVDVFLAMVESMVEKNPVMIAVGQVAAAKRHGNADALVEARNTLLARKLEDAIDRALEPDEPYVPLADADRRVLAEKLVGRKFYFRNK